VETSDRQRVWRDRSVFVTGCTGLLGSWLTEALVELGANVVGLVRDLVPQSRLVSAGLDRRIVSVRGSVEDRDVVERTLNEYEIETVFHLAAQTIVGTANRNPVSTFETNVRGTWNVLEASRRVSTVRQIVVASSDKAYGHHDALPYKEDDPLRGTHPYDVSKSCADLISLSYAETYGLPVAVTRCGNFYGGGDLNFNRIVPGTIRSVLRGERPIIRSDGTMTRDYVYIEDAVDAYLCLAEGLTRQPDVAGMAFNFSYERPMSVLEITEAVLDQMGRTDLRPIIQNQASNEIPHQYLDSSLARRVLDWQPRYALEEGLRRTVAWYEAFFATGKGERLLAAPDIRA
jgi:CDP-glucose 4,6-dehydratase